MTELRETYERAAKLIGANVNESTVCGKRLDNDYFITVCTMNQKTVHIVLVRDMHTGIGRGFENVQIADLVIKAGASDKVITNRYNKLLAIYNNR